MLSSARVLALSDTHISDRAGELPEPVLRAAADTDLILHAGDVLVRRVLDRLGQLAPVLAVAGNMDEPALKEQLPESRLVQVAGAAIGLLHGHLGEGGTTPVRALNAFPGAQAVIFGHSHQPLCRRLGEVLLLNPGSPTERRLAPHHSFGLLEVKEGQVRGEIILF